MTLLFVAILGLEGATGCGGRSNGDTHPTPAPSADDEADHCGDDICAAEEDCPRDCLDLEWIRIEGGSFSMGSDGGQPTELPRHEVTLESFELMTQEATVLAYRACVAASSCTEPAMNANSELTPPQYCTWMHDDREDHPINCISWDQASSFCRWLGARLPTEAEWEYAARGRGRDVAYPWGNESPSCERAVMGTPPYYVGCGQERTFPVCSRPGGNTPQGLCDMAGSVIEWVEDEGHDSYEGAPSNGSAWIDSGDPETRVARGGSLATRDHAYLRATVRFLFEPTQPRYVLGVRCAR